MNCKRVMMIIGAGLCVLGSHLITPVEAAPTCVWRGTAPLCAGECEQGESKATTNPRNFGVFVPPGGKVVGNYGEVCVTGSKALCCKEEFPEFVAWCSRYADDAVEQAKKNLELNCGLAKENAARWTDNRDVHLNFCLGFDGAYAELAKEGLSRVVGLKNCTPQPPAPPSEAKGIPGVPPPAGDNVLARKPVGRPTATVIADVDVYDAPGGGGAQKGVLLSNNKTTKVSLLAPCQDNWCHVKGAAVPTGEGWVYSSTDPGDFQSLQF